MKKRLLFLAFLAGLSGLSTYAQQTTPDSCSEIKAMYDQALFYLDSITGNQIVLQKRVDSLQQKIAKSKTEIRTLTKENVQAKDDLAEARKLLVEQMEKIKRLEAGVKRLSAKSPKQKE